MSIPSSTSNASSPSLTNPSSGDDVAAACFNPLFSSISSAAHINHNLNQSHSSISGFSHNHKNANHIKQCSISHNLNYNHEGTDRFHSCYSINQQSNSHSHKGVTNNRMGGNSSPNSKQLLDASPSRKVHVVYYLSRSGQLEHPHLLEVSIPPNQGLYLRDVKKRLAAIRGKRLPLTFAWSYKRSYKNGYVWQDLCDDDLIFPAHGCDYVLKGSEILSEQSTSEEYGQTPSHNSEAGMTTQHGTVEDQGLTHIIPKGVYQSHEETGGAASSSVSLHVSMVEIGTDAATQTEEELRPSSVEMHHHEANSDILYINHYKLNAKHQLTSSPRKASCTTTRPQLATELNRTDIASPPSSSSATNSPSPYKELASTSSSSASGFNMAVEQKDNVATNDQQVRASEYDLGNKNSGSTWTKCAIPKLEEKEEIISLHAADEEVGLNDGMPTNPAHDSVSSKSKCRSMGSNSVGPVIMEEGEHSPAGPAKAGRSKHSGALSLLQFMSCGGLDIKEQILPMSLYRLRSKGTPVSPNQLHMSNYMLSPEHSGAEALGYGGSQSGQFWTKMGKPKSLYNLSSSKSVYKVSEEYNTVSDIDNQWVQHKHHCPQHEGVPAAQASMSSPTANGSSAKALGGSIPDIISIGRSSISDRSTNASHELEYQVSDVHVKLKKSGEIMSMHNNGKKSSPQFNVRPEGSNDVCNNEKARFPASTVGGRAVSGEILMNKGSPLFVPSKRHLSYSGTPLSSACNGKPPLAQLSTNILQMHEAGNTQMSAKVDSQNKLYSGSCNPSRAFSEGEVSSLLANRIVASNQRSMTINSYDQSMAQLWEELLAAPTTGAKSAEHQHKDSDYPRVRQSAIVSSSNCNWEVERTLQNAVELSLQPPLEHLPLLLDCPQCGRKVKAELLKAHVKNCSSPKSNTRNSNFNSSSGGNNNHYSNSLGKSPKSDSNLCQRFLRASPPPTKS